MIKTGKEWGDCIECNGTGMFDITVHCPAGCGHKHEGPVTCEHCEGTGRVEYDQYKPDPNCYYCVERKPHLLSFFLPEIKATRGGIKFS